MNKATLDLALRCIDYLCQHHHDPDLPSEERFEKVLTGQYSFHVFSTRMWFELVCQYIRLIGAADPQISLIHSIERLWETRRRKDFYTAARTESDGASDEENDSGKDESENESDGEAVFETLNKKQPLLYQVLRRVSQFRNTPSLPTGTTNRGMITTFRHLNPLGVNLPG